ncbi:MAG: hypothetical protein CXX81_03840 [Methanobacteriota archaeon]|nr:MAG: hypothetical protein CXX81_27635 [Euryarchaeota archaeon]PXY76450.1 MAG: hypothetical protein CXX81_14685 [Euryarchaeota archaeon]PXY78402.1 MAG: hypothetical protein CXX81_07835 [Euryarchaeota archaeon]PXY79224.1 MAG: hypothetical protein CXX81_03840 [Euryarchaeota archaeon]
MTGPGGRIIIESVFAGPEQVRAEAFSLSYSIPFSNWSLRIGIYDVETNIKIESKNAEKYVLLIFNTSFLLS